MVFVVLLVLSGTAVFLVADHDDAHPIATLQTADFHALAFSPDDRDVAFFGHHGGIMRSDDGGRTWRPLVSRPNFDAMSLAVSPGHPPRAGKLYMAGHDVFQVSTDGGASWRPVVHDLPGTDVHGFAMSPDDPDRLFAFVVGHGLFRSADGGRTWRRLEGDAPRDVTALAAAGGEPGTLYVATARSGVFKTTDGGRSFTRAAGGLGPGPVLALAVDRSARQTVYAGLDGGLYKSTDGGQAWRRLPFPGANAVALAVSPARPDVLLAITVKDRQGLVFRSEDGGATWGRRN
jgi:photosystem II stability/assembly factor-like uncharacterized protein